MLSGLKELWAETKGDFRVCIAVLDGPVDRSHPCFEGANLTSLQTLVPDTVCRGSMSSHGTHIASVIFGQHGSSVSGIAPVCRGLIAPIFSDNSSGFLSQLDLARAINQAVEAGAHVINISGGQLALMGEADQMLINAVHYCADNNVLIVAAAGNDGCQCLHVPAALPNVLAVGAMDAQGLPFDFSNWGDVYQTQGILAPGENILGAEPGGGTSLKSGTSFATPFVSGFAALLLSIQLLRGDKPNPQKVRDAILESALPCNSSIFEDCRRFLAGSLNISGAYTLINRGETIGVSEQQLEEAVIQLSEFNQIDQVTSNEIDSAKESLNNEVILNNTESFINQSSNPGMRAVEAIESQFSGATKVDNLENATNGKSDKGVISNVIPSQVAPSECSCGGGGARQMVYALGKLSYDFSSEARRDSIQQAMPAGQSPYTAPQLLDYLDQNPWQSEAITWTLNLDVTPIYAIMPAGSFAAEAFATLRRFLREQITQGVERVSIPGILAGSVRLMSGQVVPLIIPDVRGMYSWTTPALVTSLLGSRPIDAPSDAALEVRTAAQAAQATYDQENSTLQDFLDRIYYELRNLGITSQERALNYAVTNAFQAADIFRSILQLNKQLDTITVEKSPICRFDSDCYDIKLTFFDPDNILKARSVFRFTIDVSDIIPVTVGPIRSWVTSLSPVSSQS